MTNAIIVAAGKSKLCKHLGYPKCLAKIGNETILDRQVRLLTECGIEQIFVAVGNQCDEIKKWLNNSDHMNVMLAPVDWWWEKENRHYGSFYSTWQLNMLWEDTIVLLGDIVFTKQALIEMLNTPLDKHGVMMLGRLDECTVGIRMNEHGAEYLIYLLQPYWLAIDPIKPYHINNISHTALWWHFQWLNQQETGKLEAPFFCPTGYIEDIDDVKDLTDEEIVKNLNEKT